jgi:hypothetical protein
VQPSDLLKFQNLTVDLLRDRHEIFDFDATHVKTMELVQSWGGVERTLKAEEKDNKWILTSSSPAAKAEAVPGLLGHLKSAEVSDFDVPAATLAQASEASKSKLIFRDEKGMVLCELRWGFHYTGAKPMLTVQNTVKGSKWYGIEESRVNDWFAKLWPEIKVPV